MVCFVPQKLRWWFYEIYGISDKDNFQKLLVDCEKNFFKDFFILYIKQTYSTKFSNLAHILRKKSVVLFMF